MDRQISGAQAFLRSLMLVLLAGGCARAPDEAVVRPATTHEQGRRVVLEANPSPAAAALLPVDARYRVVLAEDGSLALAIVTPDRRLLGRMLIAPGDGPHESPGIRVEWEEHSGRTARVEAWSSAGALRGQAFVGERSAAWRVRYHADGSLAGEGWSLPHHGPMTATELAELRRAQVIGADLGELASRGLFDDRRSCAVAERIMLAELALELGARAWTGDGRARLPVVGVEDDPCPL